MKWLNYNHLYYFWAAAREKSITRAAQKLSLAQPTLSAQLRSLENALECRLFQRVGRRLELTEEGKIVLRYAEEIFPVAREMLEEIKGSPLAGLRKLTVGLVNSVPKLIARRLLAPAFLLPEKIRLVCYEGRLEELAEELRSGALDLIISDAPLPADLKIRAFNHLLGRSAITFFAIERLARQLRRNFPSSLHNRPLLLPTAASASRRLLDEWFEKKEIKPLLIGEFEDSALMKIFGQHGDGVFIAPAAIAADVVRQYEVRVIATAEEIEEKYYVISSERIIKHPAVLAITEQAKKDIFGGGGASLLRSN